MHIKEKWKNCQIFSHWEVYLTLVLSVWSILEVDFQKMYIYCQTQKYTFEVEFPSLGIYIETQKYNWSILSKLMYFFSNPEVCLKWTFNVDTFIFKLRSKLKVDLFNLCTYFKTQKYNLSRLSELMYFFQTQLYLK